MSVTTKRPEQAMGLIRALFTVEWMFLKQALVVLVGVLPFALFTVNTSGQILAALWGIIYVTTVVGSMRVNAGLIWDALRVLFGKEPVFGPSFEREYEENKDKIAQARAVIPRPILLLLDFLQFMNPLALTAILAALYVRMERPVRPTSTGNEVPLGRSEVWALDETRRVTRRLDPGELMPVR